MTVINAMSLVFCVGAVPVELSFWDDLDFCDPLPTLEADMATDIFFLVSRPVLPHFRARNLVFPKIFGGISMPGFRSEHGGQFIPAIHVPQTLLVALFMFLLLEYKTWDKQTRK
jgi:hypothetical protein